MVLFDMISKDIGDIFDEELPFDIEEIFDNLNLHIFDNINDNLNNKNTKYNFLNQLWEKTIEICESYINTKWINNLAIDREELLIDVKNHSIFIIYLSIVNKNLEPMTIEDGFDKYEIDSDYSFDKTYAKSVFPKYFSLWLKSIIKKDYDQDYTDGQRNSDFYLSFYKDFIEANEKNIETIGDIINTDIGSKKVNKSIIFKLLVPLDPSIFYEVIRNWCNCPYNLENKYGITFCKLSKFYQNLKDVVERDNDSLNKTIKVCIIERLFNISFLYELADHLLLEKPNVSDIQFKLIVLHEILTVPMVFSRNKYIDVISRDCTSNHYTDYGFTLKNNFFYLNSYLIPLLTRVYYYLIYSYMTKEYFPKEEFYIRECLEHYIEANLGADKCYDYKKLIVGDKKMFNNLVSEELQVNITEMIYNYEYNRCNIKKEQNIGEKMEELQGEFNNFIFNSKYNFQSYNLNFPMNAIYSLYFKKSKRKS